MYHGIELVMFLPDREFFMFRITIWNLDSSMLSEEQSIACNNEFLRELFGMIVC